jgi:cytochrome c biogenesis protein CcmG/thiol:disulfide interchange protein DsbE
VRRWLQRRRLLLVAGTALAAGVLAAGVLIASPQASEDSATAKPAEGRKPAPELDGEWLVGPPVRIADLRGKPALINVWASWCVPCREEAPILNASAHAHAGEVVFLGVNVQDLRADALAFSREFSTPYVSVRDRGNRTYEDYGLTGVPETYYLDARGRIVAHSPGAISRTTLEQGIAQGMRGAGR